MKTILRAVITFFVCVCHTVLDTVSMLNKKWIPIFIAMTNKRSVTLRAIALQNMLLLFAIIAGKLAALKHIGNRKAVTLSLLLATFSLFLAAPKTNAQTSVNNFADFIAITTTTNNYNISLTGDIFFSGGNFNVLSGTITGNGYVLDGQNVNAGVLLTSGNNLFFYGPITFQNFSKASVNYGQASQGGALFVAGAYNVYLNSTTILDFASSIINFTSNTLTSGSVGGLAIQGGGLFVGGAVAAGAAAGVVNNSSGATAILNFASPIINFTSNTVMSIGSGGVTIQGGGLFIGGAVAAGAFNAGANNSSSGTAVVNFTSSTINFTNNMVTMSGGAGTAAQGGGLFVGGAVSAGAYMGNGANNSGSAIAVVTFTSSTVNFASNTVASGASGNVAQGGGLFIGGAVAAGAGSNVVNNSSSATAVVNFTSSTINFTSNTVIIGGYGTAAQGGGLFVGGAVAAGENSSNNASSATAVVNFTLSTVNFASNTVRSGGYGTAAQGGGLFVGGAVSAGSAYGVNDSSSAIAVVTFALSTVNFTSNMVVSGDRATVAQGGGLFVGGAVSAGAYASGGTNYSSSGTAVVNFASSTISFANNTVTSGNNGTASQGGGLFIGGAVSAGVHNSGAANYSSSGTATVTFTNSIVNIGNNAAQDGGGLFVGGSVSTGAYTNGVNTATNGIAQVTFAGSTITITGNTASASGGGIYIAGNYGNGASGGQASLIFENANVTIASNTATNGSAIYAVNGASVVFNNTNIEFLWNKSAGNGIAHWDASSYVGLENVKTIKAIGNQANNGGFLYLVNGVTVFTGEAIFDGNKATTNGGALYITGNTSQIIFADGSTITFTNNNAAQGGAVYATAGANVVFTTGAHYVVSNNTATYGGFIAVNNATATFKSGVDFSLSNSSATYGGFLYATNNAIANFENIYAATNTAVSGGFLYGAAGAIINIAGSTIAANVATSNGGALYITGNTSRVIFANGSTITFKGNKATQNGGAIYATAGAKVVFSSGMGQLVVAGNTAARGGFIAVDNATATFDGGNFSFSNSTASVSGGFLYAANRARVNFGGSLYTSSNSAALGGFAAAESGAVINIGSATITGNVATSSGGAIYLQTSTANFNSATGAIVFASNTANGKANDIYAAGSFINFNAVNNQISLFDGIYVGAGGNNRIIKTGAGALYISGNNYIRGTFNQTAGTTLIETATWTFETGSWNVTTSSGVRVTTSAVTTTNTAVKFDKNINTDGGALYAYASTITFNGNTVIFESNTARNFGGALYTENSSVTFNNAQINFTSNAAVSGGAIYSNLANITFNNGSATFTNNKATTGSGGAIYAVDDLVFDGANVDFTGNEALAGNGGAIFADDTILTIKNAVMTFMNNKALLGGAVYASNNSNITLSGRGNFTGNEAATNGAAVYVTGGSTVTIEAANGDIIFSGNKAAGTPNDIYADNNSRLNLITGGTNTISISGGILSNTAGTGVEVNKTGTGTLFMGGDNEIWGDFTATAGKVVLLESATFKANNIIFNGAGLDMTDADLYDNLHVNVATATTMFASDTSLLMDIFENGNNDQIFASSAQIGGNLQIKAHFGVYNNQEYHLIMSSENAINGTFANATFVYVGTGAFSYQVKYNDITDWTGVVRIIVNGINKGDFQNLPKLTFNQSEVAKTWDELSIILPTNDLKEIMEATANLSDQEEQKKVLGIASGYFHSNVIKSAALDNDNNEIYDRIKNHSTREHTNSAIWAQVTGAQTKLGGDENSLGEYKDNRYGVMAGFDIYFGSMSSINKTMLGIYVNYKDQSMSQEASKATLNKIGGGLYGGYIEESYEIKAMIGGSKDSYETTRNIPISQYLPVPPYADRNAKASYGGFTLGADVEGALKYKIGNNTNFRPYAGAELKNVSYDGFTETGADGLNLKVEAGNYLRTTARLGAGVNYDDKTWAGYVNLEGKYLLTGKKYEIESVFEGTEVKFLSRGYEENGLILGATLGGSVRITEGLKFFINANAHTAEKYTNLYANAGLRYNFCGITHKEKEEPVVEKAAPAPVVVEQPKPEIEEQAKPAIAEPAIAPKAEETAEIKEEEQQKKEALARRERPMIKKFDMKAASFALGKATLTPRAKADIANMANEMKQYKYTSITIEGHTDSTGKARTNRTLSKARAKAVYDEFVVNGISAAKMYYIGFGHTMPTDTNKTVQGRANNRRVEIFVE
ncbi:OmpA family protein [Endomicrobium proavitum]|uniref:Autotransporter domain-containing protein n=1 Tax=Endomicrobium proavitum TaxID=1408281 RepID=A0A0G3WI54_9BACT|nr:OmpA family protein [Endomicrobium proavitum]AKL97547.1 membrane protein of unknown function [Endomicrobium proavitum]